MFEIRVDPENGNDDWDGTSWVHNGTVGPKLTIQGAIATIYSPPSEEVKILLKSNIDDYTYTENVVIDGIRPIGLGAKLSIEPRHSDDSTVKWDQSVYNAHTYSPFQNGTAGTWDIKSSRPVKIGSYIEVRNSGLVEIHGLHFDGAGSGNAGVLATSNSQVRVMYSRFEGARSAAASQYGSALEIQNNYFLENTGAIVSMLRSTINLVGNNYIENPRWLGIYTVADELIAVLPWDQAPLLFATLEIKTTGPRGAFTGIKLSGGSKLKVWEGLLPNEATPGSVIFRHEYPTISAGYRAVVLEEKSLLVGAKYFEFFAQDAKEDTIPMPEENTIICADGESSIFD